LREAQNTHPITRQLGRRANVAIVISLMSVFTLPSFATVSAADSMRTGSLQLSATTGVYGQSTYAVRYQFPATVQTGSNLTFQLTLSVVDLTGLESYVTGYALVITLYVDDAHVLTSSVREPTGQIPLYPGGHWGPKNITIALTGASTGAGPGDAKNASISVALEDEVYLTTSNQISYPNSAQGSLGSVIVVGNNPNPGGLGGYFLYVSVATVVVILAVGAWAFARKRGRIRLVEVRQVGTMAK
jgi:hypothetical protein